VLEAFDKQVAVAKKQYDTSVQRSVDASVKRLTTLGDTAARNKNDDLAGRAYKEILRLDRMNQQARGFFQQRNKLDPILTQLTAEWKPLVLVEPDAREQAIFYECLLGRYKTEKDWVAAVTMVVPDGGNTFNDTIRQRIAAGAGDPSKLSFYSGTGTLIIPADGIYSITGPAREIRLNGEQLQEIREKPVEVPLKKGVYAILVTADERYTAMASITIIDTRNNQRLPIFNSLAQIRKFLTEPHEANGMRRFDVSRWTPEHAMPLRITLPYQGK